MDFARKQLEKYGWTDGKGLGRNEDGIAKPLKPKLKFDNSGVGHESGEQFTNNWWERVFNNASNNIKVENGEDGVKMNLTTMDSVEITTKNYSVKELKKNKNLEYGSFLKTSKITENGIEHYQVDVPEVITGGFSTLTDDELFAACGGRTAHKGARHGLKLNGKLARIEKQEKMLLKKMRSVSLDDDKNNLQKKMKKLKKHKEEPQNTNNQETDIISSNNNIKKKNKKKRKSVSFCEEAVVKYFSPDNSFESTPSSKDENSNDSYNDPNNCNGCDEGIEQDIDETNTNSNKIDNNNHKSFEELQRNFSDLSKAERKKLKKKRKHDEQTNAATNKFLEEVLELDNQNNKKRRFEKSLQISKDCKRRKMTREKVKMEKKMISIAQSLDHFCRISDNK